MANLNPDNPATTIYLTGGYKQRLVDLCEALDLPATQFLKDAIRRAEKRLERAAK